MLDGQLRKRRLQEPSMPDWQARVLALKRELRECRRELASCRRVLRSQRVPVEAKGEAHIGAKGEAYVRWLVGGSAPVREREDKGDVVSANGTRLEVKASVHSNRKKTCASTQSWTWGHPRGHSGKKNYHRLILLGRPDRRYRGAYRSKRAPWVIFDLPFRVVARLVGEKSSISITTNPNSERLGSLTRMMFVKYQVSPSEIRFRYRTRRRP
jgi:hypothetical protein